MTKNDDTQPTVPLDSAHPIDGREALSGTRVATAESADPTERPTTGDSRRDDSWRDDSRRDDSWRDDPWHHDTRRYGPYEPLQPPMAPTRQASDASVATPTEHPLGLISFVLALVGLWTGVLALPALIVGLVGLRRRTADRAMAIAGVAISGAIVAFGILGVLGATALLGLAGFAHLVN